MIRRFAKWLMPDYRVEVEVVIYTILFVIIMMVVLGSLVHTITGFILEVKNAKV